uniref:CSON011373 protein n=1 Tax=Culicoides sonorensis TaxID=179676 RepID=A0A336KKE7_CULSO
MQIIQCIFVLSMVIFAVNAAPAKNDDVEFVEIVPLEKRNGTFGIHEYDEDDVPTSFFPVAYFPFNIDFRSLFTGFDDLINRMRNSFHSLIDDDDVNKGNTTSTVKIVDNHKVVINDTTYKKDTPYGTQFVKVRTVHVKPLNESGEIETSEVENPLEQSTKIPEVANRDTELLEDANDESNQQIIFENLSKSSSSSSSSSSGESYEERPQHTADIQFVSLESNPIETHQSIVNQENFIPHRQPRPTFYNTNPNYRPPAPPVFPFPVNHHLNRPFYTQQRPVNEFPRPIFNSELDDNDNDDSGAGEGASEVYDLTNDIRVNQFLSEQGRPFHPDAEFISVPNQPRPRPFESYPQQYPTYYFTAFRDIKK